MFYNNLFYLRVEARLPLILAVSPHSIRLIHIIVNPNFVLDALSIGSSFYSMYSS